MCEDDGGGFCVQFNMYACKCKFRVVTWLMSIGLYDWSMQHVLKCTDKCSEVHGCLW